MFWTRFTRSSLAIPSYQFNYVNNRVSNIALQDNGVENQQLSVFAQYTQKPLRDVIFEYTASYLRSDNHIRYVNDPAKSEGKNWGEDSVALKFLANYKLNDANRFALGSEYEYNKLGRKATIADEENARISGLEEGEKFSTDMLSFFGEYQAKVFESVTLFANMRDDKHKYSPWMYSPRANIVYKLTQDDVLKLNYNRSVRHSDDADIYKYYKENNAYGDVEHIDVYELIYTKYFLDTRVDMSVFYDDHSIVAYNNGSKRTEHIGDATSYGFELELDFKNRSHEFYFSHSYRTLIKFDNKAGDAVAPNGYTDDFANWNKHITKLRYNYRLSDKLKWTNSLRIFWGLDEAQKLAEYNNNLSYANEWFRYRLPAYTDDNTRAFEESVYFNTGLFWQMDKETTVSLNGYNLLGLIDKDYNKRNFFQRTSHYRDAAPAFALYLQHKLY